MSSGAALFRFVRTSGSELPHKNHLPNHLDRAGLTTLEPITNHLGGRKSISVLGFHSGGSRWFCSGSQLGVKW